MCCIPLVSLCILSPSIPLPDAEAVDMYTAEPHVFSAALKLYLRELPVPIMTYDLYPDFIAAGSECSDKRKNLKGGT